VTKVIPRFAVSCVDRDVPVLDEYGHCLRAARPGFAEVALHSSAYVLRY
jgi:hypothetical protein